MTNDESERTRILEQLLADPPKPHDVWHEGQVSPGVWATEESCYRFIARVATPGSRTLETGAGLSTALFAALGTKHHCITPGASEVERLRAYLDREGFAGNTPVFDVALSGEVLPKLDGELDLVFIDGSHGFPLPIVDWFYAGARLREGGIVILDDTALPAVEVVIRFLDRDPRWELLERSQGWSAYRRLSSGGLSEDWWQQPFHPVRPKGLKGFAQRVVGKARRTLRGAMGRG